MNTLVNASSGQQERKRNRQLPGISLLERKGQGIIGMQVLSASLEQKREHYLVPLELYLFRVWDGPGAFSESPVNFLNFHVFWVGPSPHHPFFPHGRMIGLLGQAPPLLPL